MSGEGLDRAGRRKKIELQAKLGGLTSELDDWCDVSREGARFEKHYSQVRRLVAQLRPALEELETELEATATAKVLAKAQDFELEILDLHRVWDFFRVKLAMRAAPSMDRFLAAADDFAWACYEPAAKRLSALRKEPPLTFLGAESSPYAMPRNAPYTVAGAEFVNSAAHDLLRQLPVPVVGLPWYQVRHLPDLLIVAHEVAHHVEDDFGLTQALADAVVASGVPAQRRGAWLAWIGETFADIYGVMATGPAYPIALIDFLMTDPARIRTETLTAAEWGTYPTSYMRIAVVLAAADICLNKTLGVDLTNAVTLWKANVPTHAMTDFLPDCESIARAVLEQPIDAAAPLRIRDLITFTNLNTDRAVTAAIAAKEPAGKITTNNVRELVAAAAIAFWRNPETYAAGAASAPQARLLAKIGAVREPGTRHSEAVKSVERFRKADAEAGKQLLAKLRAGQA